MAGILGSLPFERTKSQKASAFGAQEENISKAKKQSTRGGMNANFTVIKAGKKRKKRRAPVVGGSR